MPGAWLIQAVQESVMYPKRQRLELRTLLPAELRQTSMAARERAAKDYWDRLTPEQEAWALRKMRFAEMGQTLRTTRS
jgi:hypothetical protein